MENCALKYVCGPGVQLWEAAALVLNLIAFTLFLSLVSGVQCGLGSWSSVPVYLTYAAIRVSSYRGESLKSSTGRSRCATVVGYLLFWNFYSSVTEILLTASKASCLVRFLKAVDLLQ